MIDQIKLIGFQAHTRTVLHTGHPVTSITGPTDIGKSSIIRAIRWVATNRPGGAEFINWEADEATVGLTVDGVVVARRRGATNEYRLAKETFASFGTGVPDPVALHLNIDENNFQGQHDAPFWFSLPPGEVSRRINQIINLEIIDKSLAHLNQAHRTSTATVGVCEKRLAALAAAQAGIDAGLAAATVFAGLEEARAGLLEQEDIIDELAETIATVRRELVVAALFDKCTMSLDSIARAGREIVRGTRAAGALATTVATVARERHRAAATGPLAALHTMAGAVLTTAAEVAAFARHLDTAKMQEETMVKAAAVADALARKLETDFGDLCATCGRPL